MSGKSFQRRIEAKQSSQPAGAVLPNEPKPAAKTDAQLFVEYRDRLLQRTAKKLAGQNKISENEPGDLVGNN